MEQVHARWKTVYQLSLSTHDLDIGLLGLDQQVIGNGLFNLEIPIIVDFN